MNQRGVRNEDEGLLHYIEGREGKKGKTEDLRVGETATHGN